MNPIKAYNLVEVSYPYRFRGPSAVTADQVQMWPVPTYKTDLRPGSGPPSTGQSVQGLALGYFSMHARTAASAVMGLGVRIPNQYWIAGQWTDATPTFADDTVDAQSTTAADFPLEVLLTNNDGYVVASRVPFNVVSLDIGTADTGTVVRAARYSNSAGTGWTNIVNPYVLTGAATNFVATATTAANEALVVFDVPVDWGKTAVGGLSGIPVGYYALNVRATTAPTTAAVDDSLMIARAYFLTEGIGDNGTLSQDFGAKDVMMEPVGDALFALFDTVNDGNRATALVRSY